MILGLSAIFCGSTDGSQRDTIVTVDQTVTWGELNQLINAQRETFRALAGQRIGLVYPPKVAIYATVFALGQLGVDLFLIAEISHRNQILDMLSDERSAEFLEWRYSRSPATPKHEVYCFRGRAGNEGWFALGQTRRGRRGQISGTVMLDFVWPRNRITLRDLIAAAVEHAAPKSDALFLASRPAVEYGNLWRMTIRRKLEAPQCFVLPSKAIDTIPAHSVDFVPADGDSAD
jgi:hypothetical protein